MRATSSSSTFSMYKPQGIGSIFGIVIPILFFLLVSPIAHYFWPRDISSPLFFNFWVSVLNHEGIFIICNISMYFIYKAKSPFFERYKVHNYHWPWDENYDEWIQFLKKTIALLFFNQFILVPSFFLVSAYVAGRNVRLDVESWPTLPEMILQILLFTVVEDFLFYWSHRFLHWQLIYPYIHKVHHQYKNTISLASEYAHPIEFILGNIIPTNLGPTLLKQRVHLITHCMWIIVRIVKTTEAHSGYEFSWSPFKWLPFQPNSDFHNFHHSRAFNGNYGSFFKIWDVLGKTISPQYIKEREEKEKNEGKKD